jgi:phosphonate transport system permease protein
MSRSRSVDTFALRASYPEHFRSVWQTGRGVALVTLLLLALLIVGLWRLEFSPLKVLAGLGQLGTLFVLMLPPSPGTAARALATLEALGETLAIAFLGTVLAALVSLPIGFLAARNTTLHGLVRLAARRMSDTIRSIDQLIWALIWVGVVGLGPFAGVLAVMTSDIGNFSKLFSEAIETADPKPVEGVLSTGSSPLLAIRFGLLPQVLPVLASQVLYFFESNTRSSTIIGIVGAGGIGLQLSEQIRTLEWQAVAFTVLLILVAVAAIDLVSGRLRHAVIGPAEDGATP